MIHFELVTLDGVKFAQEVYEVQLPTPLGIIGVYPNHMPLVSTAVPGIITIRHKEGDPDELLDYFATNGGVIEIAGDTIRVLADEADHESEIDAAEAEKAYERAQELKAKAKDQVSLEHAQTLIDRQAARLKLAGLRRHRGRQYK